MTTPPESAREAPAALTDEEETPMSKTVNEWLSSVGEAGVRQAIGELRGYAAILKQRKLSITGLQIECVCDFTEQYLDRSTGNESPNRSESSP